MLQSIASILYGEGYLGPEVSNDFSHAGFFIQITGIARLTELDDEYGTEIEQKRASRTPSDMAKMFHMFLLGLHGNAQAGFIVSIQVAATSAHETHSATRKPSCYAGLYHRVAHAQKVISARDSHWSSRWRASCIPSQFSYS